MATLWGNNGQNMQTVMVTFKEILAQFNSIKRPSSDNIQLSLLPASSWNMPCMMLPVSASNVNEGALNANIILIGTGPSVGAVDIGASKTAYYFRVALPGVTKDPGTLFSLNSNNLFL